MRLPSAAALFALTISSQVAAGQKPDSTKSTALTSVVVIGEKSDALARIPGAATSISLRQLRAQLPMSANEVLRTVPGIHIQEEEGAGLRANIGLRGLDPDRSRSVLVLEDGIPVALNPYGEPELYYSPPIDRMSRIEVIKGSGSILFGPQTIGGVINYVTADPTSPFGGSASIQGGAGGQQFAKAIVGGTRGNGRAILSAFQRQADDLNGLNYRIRDVTTKAGWRTVLGDFSAKLSLYDEQSNATYVGLTDSMYRADPYRHPAPDDALNINRQAGSLTHEIQLSPLTSLRTTAYAYHTARDWNRRDYTYSPTGSTLRFSNGTGARERSFDVGGIEPRLRTLWTAGSITSELEVGARFHTERARDRYVIGSVTTPDTRTVRDDEIRNGEAYSTWLQNRFALTPNLTLTPGVRLEQFAFERQITRTRVRRRVNGVTTRASEAVDIRSNDIVREFIPGIGASWTPRQTLTVFAGAHRGFAPPRTKDALIYGDPTLSADQQVPDPVSLQLDAERSWNYEVGTRVSPKDYVSFEATLFSLDFTNQIIEPSLSAGSAAAAALANQGATQHRGVEIGGRVDLGLLWARSYSLALEGNVTIADARFSRDRWIRNGADTVNVKGNVLPYAPRQRAHVALSLEHPVGLRTRVDASFVGAQFADNFETVAGSANGRIGRIPAYRIIDVAVQYAIPAFPELRLVGTVKNLTDATYIASRRPEGIKVGLPRLASLGLTWDF